jgi:hypothetical protein
VIERSLIHVFGPKGGGKTTLIERLVEFDRSKLIAAVRCERDERLDSFEENAGKNHPEIRRYLQAGTSDVTHIRFPKPDADEFYSTDLMMSYFRAALIEGDWPLDVRPDLNVYVTQALPEGKRLLNRIRIDSAAEQAESIERLGAALEQPEGWKMWLGPLMAELGIWDLSAGPEIQEQLREKMKIHLEEERLKPPPPDEWKWRLAPECPGIEYAQVVVINIRNEDEAARAQEMVEELVSLRKDPVIFEEAVDWGSRLPITACVADLSNPKDKGLRKVLTRIKRVFPRNRHE